MRQGFTLIEYVIYIGIVAIVLTSALSFAWMMINDQIKLEKVINLNTGGSLVLQNVAHYVQRADSIDPLTLYGNPKGRLVLNYSTNPQVTFDIYQKQVTLGDSVETINKLRMTEGASPAVDLTSDNVTVNRFIVSDASKTGSTTLDIILDLGDVNPSRAYAYEADNIWTISVTLRKN